MTNIQKDILSMATSQKSVRSCNSNVSEQKKNEQEQRDYRVFTDPYELASFLDEFDI